MTRAGIFAFTGDNIKGTYTRITATFKKRGLPRAEGTTERVQHSCKAKRQEQVRRKDTRKRNMAETNKKAEKALTPRNRLSPEQFPCQAENARKKYSTSFTYRATEKKLDTQEQRAVPVLKPTASTTQFRTPHPCHQRTRRTHTRVLREKMKL